MRLLKAATIVLVTGFGAAYATLAAAQDDRFGPLAELMVDGADDIWTKTLTPDGLVLDNTLSPSGLLTVSTGDSASRVTSRTVTLFVDITEGNPTSRVGLLFGGDPGLQNYYMMTFADNGVVSVFMHSPDGTAPLLATGTGAATDGVNVLTVQIADGAVLMFVNGEPIGGIREGYVGSTGIVAWGSGTYLVSSYSEDEGIVAPAVPQ